MKTTEHGIEDSKDVENVYHMRLMALLKELVRERGQKGAARVLEIDPKTVAESAKTGRLSRRVRDSLERALQEGVGSAAARQRERNERLEARIEALEKGHDELGKELRRRLAAVEGETAALRRDDGPAHVNVEHAERGASGQGDKPTSKASMRREHPDLVTREPAEDDREAFGEAWPLVAEWRELKDTHPNDGRGIEWLTARERLLTVELALLEDHGMTLPPEKQPLRGLDRSGQINWRQAALYDTRRVLRRRELLRGIGNVLTLKRWRRWLSAFARRFQ